MEEVDPGKGFEENKARMPTPFQSPSTKHLRKGIADEIDPCDEAESQNQEG